MNQEDVLLTPGQLLVMAREAIAKSPADIAADLHLSMDCVNALEEDAFEKIGVRTFVRGYLCSYARIVGVPQSQVLEAFEAMEMGSNFTTGHERVSIEGGAPIQNVTHQGRGWWLRELREFRPVYLYGIAVIALGALLLFFWLDPSPKTVAVSPITTETVALIHSAPALPAAPVAETVVPSPPPIKKPHHPVMYTVSPVSSREVHS